MLPTTAKSEISSPLRTLALLSLAFDMVTGILYWLTVAFPLWSHDPQIYVPPQALAAALTGFIAMALTCAGGLAALIASHSRGQRVWALTFLVALLLGLQGPIVIGLTLHDSSTLRLSQAQTNLSIAVSVVAFILLSILALLYAQWGVSTSRSERSAS